MEYKTFEIKIEQDQEPESPREWDNLGTMTCWHNRYTLGDENIFSTPGDFQEDIKEDENIILPLYLFDHSGLSMSTGAFSCPWDSGQVGYIHVSHEKIKKEYGWKRLTQKRIKKIKLYLIGEVETFDQYLTGDVWGYSITDPQGEDFDSCWGFYGSEFCETEAKGIIDYHLKQAKGVQLEAFKEYAPDELLITV